MILQNPITIEFPVIKKKDGTDFIKDPIILNNLDIVLQDSPKRKIANVRILPFPYALTLWSGADYDAIGDYTQAQIENKILEYIGDNPKTQLEKLFVPEGKR